MQFSLENKTADLSVGEFSDFALGPRDSVGGPQGLWRAQLGQHWHNELRARTEKEFTTGGALHPQVQFEVAIVGQLTHRGWTLTLNGRIDQLVPAKKEIDGSAPAPTFKAGSTLREIKSVTRPLPAEEADLRADYPAYFLQLAAYVVLLRATTADLSLAAPPSTDLRAELIFVEAGSGLSQTIPLTAFDEALVHHQLDAIVEFLNLRLQATARRRALEFRPAFVSLRSGQETIQQDLAAKLSGAITDSVPPLLFEAPTGYGKTGCVLELALGQLRSGRFARVIWLTGKSTGQLQVARTLEQMTTPSSRGATDDAAPGRLAFWQVRNKSEHCVNHTFHCVRDGCDYLAGCAERWPGSGLAKFYLDDAQPHDLDTLRDAGREARICPYEITRTALAFNDVWLGDFNYVFAPANRSLFFEQPGFDPAETLLIIDEAHNLPSRVAGALSHRAVDGDARLLLAELDHLRAPTQLVLAMEEWARLLTSLQPAESLDPATEDEIRELVAKIANLVSTQPLDYAALGPRHSEALWEFAGFGDFLANTKLTKLLWVARAGELEFTCVDAAPVIGETLAAFGSSILMSATLEPFGEFAASCGLEPRPEPKPRAAPVKPAAGKISFQGYTTLTAPTPWRAGAYDVAVDLRVNTTFRQRSSHYGTTAATIEALHGAASQHATFAAGSTPSRCVAVFFPSYAYAESIRRSLENSGSILRVSLQPRLPDLAAQTAWVEENLVFADALFLVLGSSFAEGIDLLGGRVTHAMVVGPALPEVNAVQKARVSAFADLGREAAFRRVYQIPGLQKVNQALGRLVRAPGQRAKVLLHCVRFADPSYSALLAADYQLFQEITNDSDLNDWLRPPDAEQH